MLQSIHNAYYTCPLYMQYIVLLRHLFKMEKLHTAMNPSTLVTEFIRMPTTPVTKAICWLDNHIVYVNQTSNGQGQYHHLLTVWVGVQCYSSICTPDCHGYTLSCSQIRQLSSSSLDQQITVYIGM